MPEKDKVEETKTEDIPSTTDPVAKAEEPKPTVKKQVTSHNYDYNNGGMTTDSGRFK